MRPIFAGIAALGLLGCVAAASGQVMRGPMNPGGQQPAAANPQGQTQQPPLSGRTLKAQTTMVSVYATVRDSHHAIVRNLTKDDFTVYEDGVEQKLAYFDTEKDLPLTLGILIDTSGSQQGLLLAEQDSASRFLRDVLRPKDAAMVMSFDTDANLLADFTEDTSVLDRAIHRTTINAPMVGAGGTAGTIPDDDQPGTVLYDAIYLACHDELASQSGRKAIILLTDAMDEGSKMTLEEAIEASQRADTVVHVLLIANRSGYFMSGQWYNGDAVARQLADQTGGRVIDVHSEKTLDKAFAIISEELRSQYVLGYYPANTKRDGTFRKIEVKVDRAGAKVLARRGYYAPASYDAQQ